jgi:hypothetical protein
MTTNWDIDRDDLIVITGYGMILQIFVADFMPRNTTYVVATNGFQIQASDLVPTSKTDHDRFLNIVAFPEHMDLLKHALAKKKTIWEIRLIDFRQILNALSEAQRFGEITNDKVAAALEFHDILKPEALVQYINIARERLTKFENLLRALGDIK